MNTAAVDREMEVRIRCPDAVLTGNLTLPDDARGLVIFAHGNGSSRGSPRNRYLNDRRLGVERCFDIPSLTKRLTAVTERAKCQPLLKPLGIGFFGSSTGAAALGGIQAVVSRGGRTDLAGDAVSNVKAATLLIVGTLDHPVVRWNRETLDLPGCEKRLALVEGATHLFTEPGALGHVADFAADWFASHLTKKRAES